MQPLTKQARDLYQKTNKTDAHKGLIFERFYDGYDNDFNVERTSDSKQLFSLVGPAGNDEQLSLSTARRIHLVSDLNGEFGVFNTDWNFVTGMGNNHPAENGFSWHPTLGTPYLPGSAVKGLLRAWMETSVFDEQQKDEQTSLVNEWFGCGAKESKEYPEGKAGNLIFFDAIPVQQPSVALDIMTPHMGSWYEQGGENVTAETTPGDWHSPIPVTFLVASDARFLFSIAPRTAAAVGTVKEAMEHLKQALAWLGAGSKTAAGYGHMSFDEQDTLKRYNRAEAQAETAREEQQLANMNPAQRMMQEIATLLKQDVEQKRVDPGGPCRSALNKAINDEAASWALDDKQALLELAEKVFAQHNGDKWKKNKKVKALYATLKEICQN